MSYYHDHIKKKPKAPVYKGDPSNRLSNCDFCYNVCPAEDIKQQKFRESRFLTADDFCGFMPFWCWRYQKWVYKNVFEETKQSPNFIYFRVKAKNFMENDRFHRMWSPELSSFRVLYWQQLMSEKIK